ncbi:MAG TPA: ribbon-helix-helix protein, CopG family [Candidatus Saccharimonadales bacterium]|nr:ribbon-helix-helix protein, CopG family [Candidatus Saccharimonadales bacterium]
MATSQGIKLDTETRDRLKTLAKKRDRSAHWLMKTAIEEYLEREERYEQEKKEDMERWEKYLLTGEAVENDKVVDWLNDLSLGKKRKWPT